MESSLVFWLMEKMTPAPPRIVFLEFEHPRSHRCSRNIRGYVAHWRAVTNMEFLFSSQSRAVQLPDHVYNFVLELELLYLLLPTSDAERLST